MGEHGEAKYHLTKPQQCPRKIKKNNNLLRKRLTLLPIFASDGTTWFEWSTCTLSCGGGEQSRTRTVCRNGEKFVLGVFIFQKIIHQIFCKINPRFCSTGKGCLRFYMSGAG